MTRDPFDGDAAELLEKCRGLLLEARRGERELRESVSYRLGNSIVRAATSWKGLAAFPGEILRLGRSLRGRERPRPSRERRAEPPTLPAASAGRRLRVAAILDEFSFHAFSPECDLLRLHPNRWMKQLDEFQPDLVFVESAWEGQNGVWHGKIAQLAPEMRELAAACRDRSLPTAFWNKEDPLSFGRFIEAADLADYVFTTDVDCVPLYRWLLGHERVFFLPFAAQPARHNPIETFPREHAACFAGAYYPEHAERRRDFATLVRCVSRRMPVEIFARRHGLRGELGAFPGEFAAMIRGSLDYADIDRAYKGYRWGLNVNTEKRSRSMFARRVWELLACNTPVLSNGSRGLRNLLGDLVVASDDEDELEARLAELDVEANYRRFRLAGLRRVMSAHTYGRRLDSVRAALGAPRRPEERRLAVVARAATEAEAEAVVAAFLGQSRPDGRLFLFAADSAAVPSAPDSRVTVAGAAPETAEQALGFCGGGGAAALFSPRDWYGADYLTDLALGLVYGGDRAVGKKTHYRARENGDVALIDDHGQYRPLDAAELKARASLVPAAALDAGRITGWLEDPEAPAALPGSPALALDEFNYIRDGSGLGRDRAAAAADMEIADQGTPLHPDETWQSTREEL